jgi:RHS repeat-associated protein
MVDDTVDGRDAAGRPRGTVTFKYDPMGRRIYKSSSAGTSIYAYDGTGIVETVNATGAVVARYTQGPIIDEPLAELQGSTTDHYQADGVGSVTSLSNAAGAVAQTYAFDSFGNTTNSSGSLTNPIQYTGREFDSETGLYYYRARYYDPTTDHFLSEDPTTFIGGINYYAYAWNNGVNLVDPYGQDARTFGPFTIYFNQKGMSASLIAAEKAHEGQHRCDFWNGNVFTKPCEFLESRGWAAEIPVLQQRIDEFRKQKTLSAAEKQELDQLIEELILAQGFSNPKGNAIHYYCHPPSKPDPLPDSINGSPLPPPWLTK